MSSGIYPKPYSSSTLAMLRRVLDGASLSNTETRDRAARFLFAIHEHGITEERDLASSLAIQFVAMSQIAEPRRPLNTIRLQAPTRTERSGYLLNQRRAASANANHRNNRPLAKTDIPPASGPHTEMRGI